MKGIPAGARVFAACYLVEGPGGLPQERVDRVISYTAADAAETWLLNAKEGQLIQVVPIEQITDKE